MLIFTGKFEIPFYVYQLGNHSDIKKKVLDYIDKDTGSPSNKNYENLAKTDWYETVKGNYFQDNFVKKDNNYYQYMKPYIEEIIDTIIPDNKKNLYVSNAWYHQYTKLNYYHWHDHPSIRWALIYYVELSDTCPRTEFVNYYGDHTYPNVKEGDILIFPAWMKHRSPPNLGNNRKTILSFNIAEKPATH